MPPEPEGPLLALQRRFARGLHEGSARATVDLPDLVPTGGIAAEAQLEVYRNNARQAFRTALALSYPVLKQRVGDEYFRQLAHEFRQAQPSRSGDLHWVGQVFPAWLHERLAATEYAWLADLARFEWACEEAAVSPNPPAVTIDALAAVAPDALDGATIRLHPSVRSVSSPYPVWSVWQANQADAPAAPVDLTRGPEHCVCACVGGRVAAWRLGPTDHATFEALQRGCTFADAVSSAAASPDVLAQVLGWAFGEGLVVQVLADPSPSAPV